MIEIESFRQFPQRQSFFFHFLLVMETNRIQLKCWWNVLLILYSKILIYHCKISSYIFNVIAVFMEIQLDISCLSESHLMSFLVIEKVDSWSPRVLRSERNYCHMCTHELLGCHENPGFKFFNCVR